MVWPFHRATSSEAPRTGSKSEAADASDVIASIFAPSHAALRSPAPALVQRAPGTPHAMAPVGGQEEKPVPSATMPSAAWNVDTVPSSIASAASWWDWRPFRSSAVVAAAGNDSSPSSASDLPASVLRQGDQPQRITPVTSITMETLPPCPLAGYRLDPSTGLVDELRQPPHTLSTREMRELIVQLSGLEQSAKHTIDASFSSQMGGRSLRALELLVNPCLFLVAIYLLAVKTPQRYTSAVPRQSFLLQHCTSVLTSLSPSSLLSRRGKASHSFVTTEQKEKLAQRHRRLMQATNARVVTTFLAGVLLFSVALVTRPGLDVVENNPEVDLGKQMVGYHQHTEASLKWLWFVYYHHPVYSREATSLLAPPVTR